MTDLAALIGCLPPGTLHLAGALADVADRRLAALTGDQLTRDGDALARVLAAPRLLDPEWPEPAPPVPAGRCGGAVQADLTDDDAETFEVLRSTLPDAGPEQLATAAQGWRLPVTPYRAPGHAGATATFGPQPGLEPAADPPAPRRPWGDGLARARVLDLTSLWAGPLCTSLLAAHGAHVTKVDPECRPDGFRSRPALYRHLNGSKHVVDLDLRRAVDRSRFDELVRSSDLVVHSFSRRVLPNLGYGPERLQALRAGIATLAITAFPAASPQRDWLAYGSGVHAMTGWGLVDGHPTPAAVAYPDPLAGLAAFAVALSLLGLRLEAPAGGHPPPAAHADVSLAGVVAPLVSAAVPVGAGAP